MLEEGIRLPHIWLRSIVQPPLHTSTRPLTIDTRHRGQGYHLFIARPRKTRQVRMIEPGHRPLRRPCKDTRGIDSSRHTILARQPLLAAFQLIVSVDRNKQYKQQ